MAGNKKNEKKQKTNKRFPKRERMYCAMCGFEMALHTWGKPARPGIAPIVAHNGRCGDEH